MVKAVSAINAAVDGGDPESTLETLKAPPASIRSITEECAESYQEKLLQARQEKMEAGRFGGGEDERGWGKVRKRREGREEEERGEEEGGGGWGGKREEVGGRMRRGEDEDGREGRYVQFMHPVYMKEVLCTFSPLARQWRRVVGGQSIVLVMATATTTTVRVESPSGRGQRGSLDSPRSSPGRRYRWVGEVYQGNYWANGSGTGMHQ